MDLDCIMLSAAYVIDWSNDDVYLDDNTPGVIPTSPNVIPTKVGILLSRPGTGDPRLRGDDSLRGGDNLYGIDSEYGDAIRIRRNFF